MKINKGLINRAASSEEFELLRDIKPEDKFSKAQENEGFCEQCNHWSSNLTAASNSKKICANCE